MEVDLKIPESVHEFLDKFPVAPEKMCPPDSKVEKLMLTHYPKKNYVIHWRFLKMFVSLGVKVVKIHRAIRFKQAKIFKEYIDTMRKFYDEEIFKLKILKIKKFRLIFKKTK